MKNLMQEISEYNADVSQLAYRIRAKLKSNLSRAVKGEGTLVKNLRTRLHKDYGEIDLISYHFPRHGVFYQKGVGRGNVMKNGRVVRGVKEGKTIRLLPGNVTRTPHDWFDSTLKNETPKLADIVADHKADEAAINVLGINKK